MKNSKWQIHLLCAAVFSIIVSIMYFVFWCFIEEEPITIAHLAFFFGMQTLAFFAISLAMRNARSKADK